MGFASSFGGRTEPSPENASSRAPAAAESWQMPPRSWCSRGRVSSTPKQATRSASTAPSLPAEDLPGEPPRAREEAPPARKSSVVVDVAAGLSASLAGGDVAMGGRAFGAFTSRGYGVGGTIGVAALGARSSGSGTTTWERYALSVGPHYRFTQGPVRVDLHAEFIAGLLSVVSSDGNGSGASFDPGVSGGVRVLGPVGLWGGVQGTAWPRSPMPRFEVLLSAGLSWTSG